MKKIYTELVKDIARETSIEEADVRKVMDSFISTIKNMYGKDEGVIYLKGLGKFYIKTTNKRKCGLTNCLKVLPPMRTIAFHRSNKTLKWEVKK